MACVIRGVLAKGAQTEEETLDHYRKVHEEIKHFVLKLSDCLSTLEQISDKM